MAKSSRADAALEAIKSVLEEVLSGTGKNMDAATGAVTRYIAAIRDEVEEAVAAAADAAATGGDVDTWLKTLESQVDEALLKTVHESSAVSFQLEKTIRRVSLSALRAVVFVAKVTA
jgi:hypothetical protein